MRASGTRVLIAVISLVSGLTLLSCGEASSAPPDRGVPAGGEVSGLETPGQSAVSISPTSDATRGGASGTRGGPAVIITGRVQGVAAGDGVIHLQESVHGFTRVVPTNDVRITGPDGSSLTPWDLKPGSVIQASGSADGQGGVVARTIKLLGNGSDSH